MKGEGRRGGVEVGELPICGEMRPYVCVIHNQNDEQTQRACPAVAFGSRWTGVRTPPPLEYISKVCFFLPKGVRVASSHTNNTTNTNNNTMNNTTNKPVIGPHDRTP